MYYAIWATDVPNSWDNRKFTRPAHVERIQSLVDEGRVLIAGPMPAVDSCDPGDTGMTGSLMVIEFASLQEAEEWAKEDPYLVAGVYDKLEVKPFIKALP